MSGNQTECVPDQWEMKHGRRGEWVTGGPGSCMVHGEVTGLGHGKSVETCDPGNSLM